MRQLNVHKLVSDLNNLCNALVKEYDINCGGCCYVAYEIAKHLDRFHIGYELHILNDCPLNQDKINREVRSKRQDHGFGTVTGDNTCCHYYIVIKGGGPVNRGNPGSWYRTYVITGINHRNLNWIYRISSWNSVYKRKNNKLIKKIISLHFRQYGKAGKNNLCSCKGNSMPEMQVCG